MSHSDTSDLSARSNDAASAELARVQEALRVSEAGRRESQTFFAKSFEANPAFMTIGRIADGRLIEVNPAFVRGSGYSRDEAIGRSTLDLNLWVDRSERDEFLRRMKERGCVRDFVANFRAKSGEVRTLLLNADVIHLEGPPCMLTVGVDITERRRREQVQEATYEISQAVLAGGDLGALFKEMHRIIGRLMPARNFYVALLSADGSELSFPFFVDEHVAPPPPRTPGNGFSEYVLFTGEPLLATADELVHILAARGFYQKLDRPAAQRLGAPLRIEGRAIGVIAIQDYENPRAFSEEDKRLLMFVADQMAAAVHRRFAEEALRRAELQYRGIFENAVEGLYQTSPDGRFLKANPALACMFGYESPAALMRSVNDIGHQLYVDQGRRGEFLRSVESGRDEVTDFQSEVRRQDGSRIWISESVRVVRDAQGKVLHFEGVAVDITHQREAALALRAAKDAADAASRAKSYFLASVSHELRTPLNGILGYTQILRRDAALGDKQREGVRVIHESAEHLLALINDVLDLSKIEAGRIELQPADFDLVDFVAGVERVFAPRARDKSLMLETQVDGDVPRWVHGDEQRLRQVVFNLVANAVTFTKRGGVVLSVKREGEAVRFSVSDTGPGIMPQDVGKLFEPFTQLGGPRAGGTGLGLAISRSLVERMGGKLQVESKPGWGSRFWFAVPLPTASGTSSGGTTSGLRRVSGYEGPVRRVLIVDDHAANRSLLVDLLAPIGFDIAQAVDGVAALDETKRFSPDLVLMDLRLPGPIDGLEATRQLRAREAAAGGDAKRRLAIVAVSASAYDLDRSECIAAGCDAFLAKPFREEELWNVMARVLGLTWKTIDPDETRTPFPMVVEPPPEEEAAAIYELAAKGDVVAIRARAQALVARDARYQPFAQGVLDLAGRFKMKAIRQFVARYAKRETERKGTSSGAA